MKEIKVQAPAKINLTLDILNKREDGFHELKSIMHAINLYDYLTITKEEREGGIDIELSGNSTEIPYDEHNLVYKAARVFFDNSGINNTKISIYIEKNIPVSAGLAGGSTDAAATLLALNTLYDFPLSKEQINQICATLGSDLNFCLKGGCAICTSRGEKIRTIPFLELPISIVKPKNLKISAKEAFQEFDFQNAWNDRHTTEQLTKLIVRGNFDISLVHNDLEQPLLNKYFHLKNIKKYLKNCFLTGSGPIIYTFTKELDVLFNPEEFTFVENLRTIGEGVKIIKIS
jgi:4-diphosphocytidyl-2-C-methyl-D-erythritol kinase